MLKKKKTKLISELNSSYYAIEDPKVDIDEFAGSDTVVYKVKTIHKSGDTAQIKSHLFVVTNEGLVDEEAFFLWHKPIQPSVAVLSGHREL